MISVKPATSGILKSKFVSSIPAKSKIALNVMLIISSAKNAAMVSGSMVTHASMLLVLTKTATHATWLDLQGAISATITSFWMIINVTI